MWMQINLKFRGLHFELRQNMQTDPEVIRETERRTLEMS
jgi:hypothetical protein